MTSSFFRQTAEPTPSQSDPTTAEENWAELVEQDPGSSTEFGEMPLEDELAETGSGEDYGEVDDEESLAPPEAPPARRSTTRLMGIALALVGLGLGVATIVLDGAARDAISKLSAMGLGAPTLVLAGIALATIGSVRDESARRGANESRRTAGLEQRLRRMISQLPTGTSSTSTVEDPMALKVELERLDEKISNLTRATKLYGTPLLEISNQVAELSNRLQDVGDIDQRFQAVIARLNTGESINKEDLALVMRAIEGARDRTIEVLTTVRQTGKEVIEAAKKGEESLQGKLDRTTGAVEDCQLEVLQSLRGTHEESRRMIADASDRVIHAMEQASTSQTSKVAKGQSTIEALESVLTRMHADVQSLATAVARLEARPVARGASTEAPARTADKGEPTTPQSSTTPTASKATPAEEDAVPKIAGSRQAPTKNVLGAIAKLRSMRS